MTDTENKSGSTKQSTADIIRQKLTTIAASASEQDRKAVDKLIRIAQDSGDLVSVVQTLTPAMCALIFLFHNSHNRPWSPQWTLEMVRRMENGLWRKNSMAAGFYTDGTLEDGQHRLAASALAGMPWTVAVVFGIEHDAIDTVDGGRRRSGADHAFLDGIIDPSKKQQIVKAAAAYFLRLGDKGAALRSEAEVKAAIEENDALLSQALEIAAQSRANLPTPLLKEGTAAAIAYVLSKALPPWPTQTIREKLAFMQQAGGSALGENDPFFLAAKALDDGRKRSARGEKLTTTKEMGIVIFAFSEAERGQKAVHKRKLEAAVKKTVPDPRYPDDALLQAAE